jgi:hypothetical protein
MEGDVKVIVATISFGMVCTSGARGIAYHVEVSEEASCRQS